MRNVNRWLLGLLLLCVATTAARAEDKPARVSLDWATYNPVGMVLKAKGWLEEDLGKDGIAVEWNKSVGGPQSIGLLNSGKADFASTGGGAALESRIKGSTFKTIYVFSNPTWAGLVTKPDSPIKTVADLKGKRIAAARGTEPHLLLVRALADAGVPLSEVTIVVMTHPNGKAALDAGDVDAWGGLDPMMAQGEEDGTGRIFYQNPDYNTFGVLSVSETFAKSHPTTVRRVLAGYEKARLWAIAHPDEVVAMLAEATGLPKPVIARQMRRTDLTQPVIGEKQRNAMVAAGKVLQSLGVAPESVKIADEVDAMLDSSFLPKAAQ